MSAEQIHDIGKRRAWVIWLVSLGAVVSGFLFAGALLLAGRLSLAWFRVHLEDVVLYRYDPSALFMIGQLAFLLSGLGTLVVLVIMLSVVGLYLYLQWLDKKHQGEMAARREVIYAQRREAQHGGHAVQPAAPAAAGSTHGVAANDADEAWRKAVRQERFRFRFSLAQLMLAMISAAIVMGFASILGAHHAATLLGFVALAGLVAHAIGVEPPAIVVLVWWLVLVSYVLLSITAVIRSAV